MVGAPVLIQGETEAGRSHRPELHAQSPRASKPPQAELRRACRNWSKASYSATNAAHSPALSAKVGIVRNGRRHRPLDEIRTDVRLHIKLFRSSRTRNFNALAAGTIKVDVRIMATHRNLERAISTVHSRRPVLPAERSNLHVPRFRERKTTSSASPISLSKSTCSRGCAPGHWI